MYFASRIQAGRMLASQLIPKYRYEDCVVVALDDGGVMVGAQIAMQLHCILTMLLTAEISLPREPVAIAGITSEGNFVYNHEYSQGEIDEIASEHRNTIEQEKLAKLRGMSELLGSGGMLSREILKGHNVILVSDGIASPFIIDMAVQFLKPVSVTKLIVATPLASVKVVDQIHISADEIYCLDVPNEYMYTDHYYDKQDVPDHKTVVDTIEHIILSWQ
jgi:putative phosphoribosyl transferase